MKNQRIFLVLTAILVMGTIVPAVFADAALTTERFRDTGNLGIAAGGVGLQDVSDGDITLNIPNSGTTVVAAYLYWSGYDILSGGDDEVTFEGSLVTVEDQYGPDEWFLDPYDVDHYCFVYVADVTSEIEKGNNVYSVEGVDFDRNFGAGIIAVYENKELPLAEVTILDGLDNFWFGWPSPRGPNSEVTAFTFDASVFDCTGELVLFAGATEHDDRPNKVWIETDSGTAPANLISPPSSPVQPYDLIGSDGASWDTYMADVDVSAGDEWLGVQVESIVAYGSGVGDDGVGTSGVLVASGFVLPLPIQGGKVTGGGQIEIDSGGKGSFGFNAMWYSRDAFPKGELEYIDHEEGIKVHAHDLVDLYVYEDNPGNKPWPMRFAYFEGPCTVDHEEGYYFTCLVEDDAEPGTADRFTLTVYEGVDTSGNIVIQEDNTLMHGNIQIHIPPK